jgi:translation initiation factor 1
LLPPVKGVRLIWRLIRENHTAASQKLPPICKNGRLVTDLQQFPHVHPFFLCLTRRHAMKSHSPGGLVYSTDSGRMCPVCRQPQARCICRQAKAAPASDGIVRVSRETKGRGGKSVTLVKGLALPEPALVQLGKQLKAACGSGGTVKDGVIEVQGDHVALLIELLKKQGHTVKQAGGKAA